MYDLGQHNLAPTCQSEATPTTTSPARTVVAAGSEPVQGHGAAGAVCGLPRGVGACDGCLDPAWPRQGGVAQVCEERPGKDKTVPTLRILATCGLLGLLGHQGCTAAWLASADARV